MVNKSTFATGDSGDRKILVELNVNQLLFIVAGLRDLAMDWAKGDSDDNAIAVDNKVLADYLEGLI